ncbi:MAG: bifunctional glutamate N-acetyltransferase/amino-acid acetyltransferase ArgJ [Acidobacteria bacterium]|nr:bifunctional glutamate N-acetyltransferase/amino-acid acetyltransferase ArgJ [Acidobacteriota bacterium]
MITTIEGGITAPAGFRAAGVHCGIKANPERLDLALVVSDTPATAAAVFTTNLAVAPPIVVSREHLRASGGHARAVVINSGCANACTGDQGRQVAHLMAAETARAVECDLEEVLVMSTGVIGVQLDPRTVTQGIIAATDDLSRDGHARAAHAIMTTDPFPKERAVEVTTPKGTFRVGGISKGSGMIEPRMATMLGVLTCDAAVPAPLLQRVLAEVTDHTFNAITVDGECSTNDCVALLANGASGVTIGEAEAPLLSDALYEVARFLATEIVRGGEGATKLVTVTVTGARTYDEAKQAARAIANSLLVKTAIHGGDPNWGRLVAVAGRAGVGFDLQGAAVRIGDVVLFEGGRPFDERAPQAAEYLRNKDISVSVDLGTGGGEEATMWTCDLSREYVTINAEYRT